MAKSKASLNVPDPVPLSTSTNFKFNETTKSFVLLFNLSPKMVIFSPPNSFIQFFRQCFLVAFFILFFEIPASKLDNL